jgi:peptidoglycan/LPS O-acetylase OafA/YrhL
MTAKNISLKYIPELDGLRAIAAFGVMFFHLHIPGFSLGWSGVYLFFVLSGFLITTILIDSKDKPNYFFRFYSRRSLRILPIYYITLLLALVVALTQRQSIRDFPLYLIYLQNNILGWKQWSVNFPAFMNHTWSLAVETQFYLVYPLLIFYLKEKYLLICSLVIIILSFLFRVLFFIVFPGNPNLLFAISPTAIDSLTIGAILAIVTKRKNILQSQEAQNNTQLNLMLFTLTILIAIIAKTGINNYWSPSLWGRLPVNLFTISVISTFFALLISYIISTKTVINTILKLPILNHLGKISYGLYLYHFPVFSFFQFFHIKIMSNIYIYIYS